MNTQLNPSVFIQEALQKNPVNPDKSCKSCKEYSRAEGRKYHFYRVYRIRHDCAKPIQDRQSKSNPGEYQMKNSSMLTISSLLLVLFLTFHLAGDIVFGFEPGGLSNLVGGVLITVVWLCGTLLLSERRSGYIIMLLGSLFSLIVPIIHMKGKGVGVTSRLGHASGHFFFVWTLLAIGVLGLFSAILATRGLWSLPWRRPR
jgi:hypothetical protein